MAIAGFEQDPNAMPGMGFVSDEFGNKRYLQLPPELAQQFGGGQPAPAQDLRLAMGPMSGAQAQQVQYAAGGQRQGQSVSMSDAPAFNATVPASAQQERPKDPTAATNAATGDGAPQNLTQAIANQSMNSIGQAMLREQNQKPRTIAGGYTPKSREESVGQQGRPVDAEEVAGVNQTAEDRSNARFSQAQAEAANQYGMSAEAYAAMPKQYAQMEAAQKKSDEVNARVANTMQEFNDNSAQVEQAGKDFNPNRLFSGGAGTVAGIGAAIFRAMGAYAQIKGRMSSNPAGEVIDAAIQRDIEQQKEQIASGRANVDNALKRLTIYRGDAQQAESELKGYMQTYAAGRMKAYAIATGLPEVQANMQKDLASIEQQRQDSINKMKDRAYGVHAAKVDEAYRPTTTTGGPVSVDKALERAGKVAGIAKTFNEADVTGNKAQKATEGLLVPDGRGGQIQARTEDEAKSLRTTYSSMIGGVKIADKMAATANDTNLARGLVPWNASKERTWNTDREALMHAFNNSLVGNSAVVREASMERFATQLAGKPWSPGAQAALTEIKGILQDHYQQELAPHQTSQQVQQRAPGAPIVEDAP